MSLLGLAVTALAVVVLLPSLVLLVEVIAGCVGRPKLRPADQKGAPRMAVVVPAHDEAAQIATTVRSLRRELGPGDRLLVVADNCHDATAALARGAGAEVIERVNPGERGKGFAISFAVARLSADPPDVVVLVDADCAVTAGRLSTLARVAVTEGRSVQADYVLAAPAGVTAAPAGSRSVTGVNAFAVLVRNRVRALGLSRIARACQLTGSGMAFPWRVLAAAPAMRGNLVEDLALGLELALQGRAPRFCPEVRLSSELPTGAGAGLGQRRRWEHGQLHTMMTYLPRLLVTWLRRPQRALLGLALDLLVPPLALLVLVHLVLLALTGMLAALHVTAVPLALALASSGCVTIATVVAWLRFGRQTLSLAAALRIPWYVAWKVGLYATLLVHGKQRAWERTARDARIR